MSPEEIAIAGWVRRALAAAPEPTDEEAERVGAIFADFAESEAAS